MMKHTLATLLIACLAVTVVPASAQTETPAKKAVKKVPPKKAVKPPVAVKEEPIGDDEESKEPDVAGTSVTEFHCELGNKLTIYRNDGDDKFIALRWGKRLHRMTRVGTTTGAIRFENKTTGLVWIGIPAKGILLNAKIGQQLANECKDPDQMKPKALVAPVGSPTSAAPAAAAIPAALIAPQSHLVNAS